MRHPDKRVDAALIALSDALVTLERDSGVESVFVFRDSSGASMRAVSGKTTVRTESQDITDQDLFESLELAGDSAQISDVPLAPLLAVGTPGSCARCGDSLVFGVLDLLRITTIAGKLNKTATGQGFILDDGLLSALYCGECMSTLRFCHRCGCTEEAACPEICGWSIERPELCTSCDSNAVARRNHDAMMTRDLKDAGGSL